MKKDTTNPYPGSDKKLGQLPFRNLKPHKPSGKKPISRPK